MGVAELERRLLIAVMGPLFVTVSFVASELVQNVYAQPNVVRAAGDEGARADLKAIQRELNELRNELKALEVRVTAVEEELNALEAVPRAIGRSLPTVLAAVAGTAVIYFFVTRLSQIRQVPRVAIALLVLGVFDAGLILTFGNYPHLFSSPIWYRTNLRRCHLSMVQQVTT